MGMCVSACTYMNECMCWDSHEHWSLDLSLKMFQLFSVICNDIQTLFCCIGQGRQCSYTRCVHLKKINHRSKCNQECRFVASAQMLHVSIFEIQEGDFPLILKRITDFPSCVKNPELQRWSIR